jgi:uncharacterized protein YbjT (DUF2867 family)
VKLLVTGGSGFIGGHLVPRLRADGHDLRCLVRNVRKAAGLGCELLEGDVTDPAGLRRATEDREGVVHLVSIRQGRPEQFERVMTQGTRDLIAASKDAGVSRFVLMSALGTTEESKDLVPYYRAKWEMEQVVKGSGIDHVIFRPSFVFARDGGILPTFRRIAKIAPVTPITGSGRQRLQPIWVDDVVNYFARSLELSSANRTFELGGPDVVTWNELWQRLKRVLGVRRPSIHVPMGILRAQAFVVERLPGDIPLTRDLLKMLEHGDNVVSNDDAVREFKLPLVPLDEQLRRAA